MGQGRAHLPLRVSEHLSLRRLALERPGGGWGTQGLAAWASLQEEACSDTPVIGQFGEGEGALSSRTPAPPPPAVWP